LRNLQPECSSPFHKSQPLHPTRSQFNPFSTVTPNFSKISATP
jgi:hypothetical protein